MDTDSYYDSTTTEAPSLLVFEACTYTGIMRAFWKESDKDVNKDRVVGWASRE